MESNRRPPWWKTSGDRPDWFHPLFMGPLMFFGAIWTPIAVAVAADSANSLAIRASAVVASLGGIGAVAPAVRWYVILGRRG